MFDCLHYSVTINESKEKFRIVFCCFSGMKNIVASSSSFNSPVKLIFREIFVLNIWWYKFYVV